MYVNVQARGCGILGLLDCGSKHTILSSAIYTQFSEEQRPPLEQFHEGICQADGRPLEIWGKIAMEVKIGRQVHLLHLVVAKVRNQLILGMDFLLGTGARMNFGELCLMINGEKIPCESEKNDSFCMRLEASSTTFVPAGHEAYVHATCKGTWKGGIGLASPVQQSTLAKKGLMAAYGIVDPEQQDDIYIKICNVGEDAVAVKSGELVAKMTPVAEDDITSAVGDITSAVNTLNNTDGETVVPEFLTDLLHETLEDLPEDPGVPKMLGTFQDVFASTNSDLGRTGWTKHGIVTKPVQPSKLPARRAPIAQQKEIDRQVKDLLERGLISPSNSPWSSPVVLVAKKDGSTRLCCDYRRLNSVTIKDAFPLPRIDTSLDALAGAKWFSTLDLASGYWQVELDEDAKKKSAFAVKGGLYEWNVMSFGLCNAPSTFERLMERVLAGLHWETLLVYLDDIIVWGRTLPEALSRLETVLQRLREAGLKVKPSKCQFLKRSVNFLGHVVSAEGVATAPEKIQAVKEWPTPRSVRELRSFLGLAQYYRKFIYFFSHRAKPLYQLLEKNKAFKWTSECQAAFQDLKDCLISAPILAYPYPEGQFVLDTDASGFAIGAVLSQEQEGELRVIAYGSRTLSKAQRNYCVTRRELLAVVAFLKYFRHYLYGQRVKVRTDHGALRWLINFKDPEGQLARWLSVISSYNLELEHRPGRLHGNADSLSRRPCPQCGRESHDSAESDSSDDENESPCPSPRVLEDFPLPDSKDSQVLVDGPATCPQPAPTTYSEQSQDSAEASEHSPDKEMFKSFCRYLQTNVLNTMPVLTLAQIRDEQLKDMTIKLLYECKEAKKPRPTWEEISACHQDLKTYWAQWDLLDIHDGVLCRQWISVDGNVDGWKVILPVEYRSLILQELHNSKSAGHMGERRTLHRVKARYYWAGMRADVRSWVRQCSDCARRKPPPRKRRSQLRQYLVGAPLERVALDILGPLPVTYNGNEYVLVIGDYFSKWIEAVGIPDQTAETVANKFADFVCRFGIPKEVHSDQGRNFESHVFQETLRLLGVNKTRTTAYNPKSDGMIERYNKTLMNIVSLLLEPICHQKDWDEQLKFAGMAYRSSRHESTGETPNMLMLGREIGTPLDLMVETPGESQCETDYAWEFRERLRQAHDNARKVLKTSAEKQKKHYDRKVTSSTYKEQDFVWLHNPQRKIGVSSKLRIPWEGPYMIVDKLSDVHVRIQKSPRATCKIVHADRIKLYQGPELQTWPKKAVPADKKDNQPTCSGTRLESEQELTTKTSCESGQMHATALSKSPVRGPKHDLPPLSQSTTGEVGSVHRQSDISLSSNEGRRNPARRRQKPTWHQDYVS